VFSQADAYDRFMGRYSSLLSSQMADLAGVKGGQRVVDVGCGPGALTAELVARLGPDSVAAVDPSEPFVAAVRARYPGVDAHVAPAEKLPFADRSFDAALAQLVVHFMREPVAGIGEMARVTKRGGAVVACVWDTARRSPITPFWRAVQQTDPTPDAELGRPGVREGHLAELFHAAGLRDVTSTTVSASLRHDTFESWWHPFELGVGPAGVYVARLDADARDALRERARALMPPAPFTHTVHAWAARGVV
jgi:ubiquinone/menaquinone biosynthesis C-methylase UbiE